MKRILAQEKNNVISPCFYVYGLHGVCHQFSARLHNAGKMGSINFNNIKTGYNDPFSGGRISRIVYGQYGATPSFSTIGNVMKGTALVKQNLKQVNNPEFSQLFAKLNSGVLAGTLSAVSSVYHNYYTCKAWYSVSCPWW